MLIVQQKQLLCTLINDYIRVASWGITNISIDEEKISFNVNGFNYCGDIINKSDSSGCYNITKKKKKNIKCHLDELIDTLDRIIEASDDYLIQLENIIRS